MIGLCGGFRRCCGVVRSRQKMKWEKHAFVSTEEVEKVVEGISGQLVRASAVARRLSDALLRSRQASSGK